MAGLFSGNRRPDDVKATAWDKISGTPIDDQLAYRDIHGRQQLDRAERLERKSKTPGNVLACVVGALVFIVAWLFYSLAVAGLALLSASFDGGLSGSADSSIHGEATPGTDGSTGLGDQHRDGDRGDYWLYEQFPNQQTGVMEDCYRVLKENGMPSISDGCFDTLESVPVPQWYVAAGGVADTGPGQGQSSTAEGSADPGTTGGVDGSQDADATAGNGQVGEDKGFGDYLFQVSMMKILLTLGPAVAVGAAIATLMGRRVDKHNVKVDHSDINDHTGDQHIALPEEIQRNFDFFPNAGATSYVQASGLVSHNNFSGKGLQKVKVLRRAEADILDEDGEILYHKGEVLYGDDGEALYDMMPIIDEQFGKDLFEASGVPEDKRLRKFYDPFGIPYNPGNENRDKLAGPTTKDRKGKTVGGYATVGDLIKADWQFPEYEVQRPSGAYIVDTAPVNTMVLAITRAGKGQTYIEPMIDIWSRERRPSNMVVNDPKGELLVKNYVPLTTRGFEVVQFNLINVMKTDIYNPLGMAAEAAREGDPTKCAMYVENIAEVFFPADGGDDPVWANSANNAFKRCAYGLIEFYLEQERIMREEAVATGRDKALLERDLDDMWAKVTLYNCYQMFVQMSAKKLRSPKADIADLQESGEWDTYSERLQQMLEDRAEALEPLWEGKEEADYMSLYFGATEWLPADMMRSMIGNVHNSLKAMGGAEKMLASVYGIAITAMSFFTDPTIRTLTSGKPSQNTDLASMSFPRRFGVRLDPDFMNDNKLKGLECRWKAFGDPEFTQDLGEDFEHTDMISMTGWAMYYFKGIFPKKNAWLRLQLHNQQTGLLVRSYFFKFTKSNQLSLNGRHVVVEPVSGEKVVRHGVLRELQRQVDADGNVTGYEVGDSTFDWKVYDTEMDDLVTKARPVFMRTSVRYTEKPKALFLVTPPHLMKYAKLILILIKQLVDLNFDQSYMTKSSQKPLYRTRFMLDELGNLQSEGKGISGLETMLSIGLGQEQQFTLILQTLQQLRNVYGDDTDKVLQGNAQPLHAGIATPQGFVPMGQIQVGDEVLIPAGGTARVDGVYPQGERPVYEVLTEAGQRTQACNEHLWDVEIIVPEGVDLEALLGH